MCTDWTHLDQQQFKEACDELATAIDHPVHLEFRRRHKTAPEPPPPSQQLQYVYLAAEAVPSTAWALLTVAAAPTQPPAQPAGSQLLSEHVRGSTRSAVLCGETAQRASSQQSSPRSILPTTPTEALQLDAGCSAGKASLWRW